MKFYYPLQHSIFLVRYSILILSRTITIQRWHNVSSCSIPLIGRGAGMGCPIALLLSHQPVNPFKNKKTHTFNGEDMGFFVGGTEVLASSLTNYSNRVNTIHYHKVSMRTT